MIFERIEKIEEDRRNLKDERDYKTKMLQNESNRCHKKDDEIRSLKDKTRVMNKQYGDLKKENETLRRALETNRTANQALSDQNKEIETLTRGLQTKRVANQVLSSKNENLEKSNAELNDKATSQNQTINSLNKIIKSKDKAITSYHQEFSDKYRIICSLNKTIKWQKYGLWFGIPAAFGLGIFATKYGPTLFQKASLTAFALGRTTLQTGNSWLGTLSSRFFNR